jgi:hypothetical protein
MHGDVSGIVMMAVQERHVRVRVLVVALDGYDCCCCDEGEEEEEAVS